MTTPRWRCFICTNHKWHPGGLAELNKHRKKYHLDVFPSLMKGK